MTHDSGLGFWEEIVTMESFLGRRLTLHEIGLLLGPRGQESGVDPNILNDSAQLNLLATYVSDQYPLRQAAA